MKLLIDIGNTRLKSSLLDGGRLIEHRSLCWHGEALGQRLSELWAGQEPEAVAIASVAGSAVVDAVSDFSLKRWQVQAVEASYRGELFGLRCGYEQPETLGIDRWLGMLGAWGRRAGPSLVADLGTAATLDVIDGRGQHLGGCIFAGIDTQRRALSIQTAALPEVDGHTRVQLATDTKGGVALGTLISVAGGVRELFSSVQQRPDCEGIELCLTGGAAPSIAAHLGAQASLYPHLVLEGLAMSEFNQKISSADPVDSPA